MLVICFSLIALLQACTSNGLRITYNSEPQGAMISIVDSILSLGRAPTVRYYPLSTLEQPDENGCVVIPGVMAKWDSGASATINRLRICDIARQTQRYIDLPRPRGYPGLDIDLEVASQRARELNREREFNRIGVVEPPRSNPTGNR